MTGSARDSGGAGGGGGGAIIPDPGPWSKVAPKPWGMSVSPGSVWSIAGGGGGSGGGSGGRGGGGGYTASPHHTNSTELAMSLYGAGGAGTHSRSPPRRG